MVQATDFGNLHDLTRLRRFDWPHIRRILLEREASPCPAIVHEVASQDPAQVPFVQDQSMVEIVVPCGKASIARVRNS